MPHPAALNSNVTDEYVESVAGVLHVVTSSLHTDTRSETARLYPHLSGPLRNVSGCFHGGDL